VFMLS